MEDKTVQIGDYVYRLHRDSATVTAWNKARKCVELPNRVEGLPVCSIAPEAFDGCNGLRDLSLPASMEHLPLPEFRTIPTLESIRVSPQHEDFSSQDGILYNKDKSVLIDCPPGRKKPASLPDTVRKIGRTAFQECRYIPEIKLPPSLEIIEESAFSGCRSLRRLDLPESVWSIGRHALNACRNLRALHFSADLTEPPLLHGCKSLRSVSVSPGNPALSDREGVLYNADGSRLLRCPQGKAGAVHIPGQTAEIAPEAFGGCDALTAVYVDSGNVYYSDCEGALYNADRSRLLLCPSGLAGTLHLPAETASLAPDAFPPQILPALLTDEAGDSRSCWISGTPLTAIEVSPRNEYYTSVGGVLYDRALRTLVRCPCGFAGALTVPDSVEVLAGMSLRGCSELTELYLPEGLREIGSAALNGCFQLRALRIPPSVRALGTDALAGCVHLRDLFIAGAETVIGSLGDGCCAQLTLHAPQGSPAAEFASAAGIRFLPIPR